MTFYEVLTAAVNDFILYGFDNQERLDYWLKELKTSAVKLLITPEKLQKELERSLRGAYTRLVDKGGLVNKDVSRFTVDRLKPKMRAELDRRILASVNLIKYNREETISNMLRRFSGWATSIPIGGSNTVDKREEKKQVKKSLGMQVNGPNLTSTSTRFLKPVTFKRVSMSRLLQGAGMQRI